MRHDVLGARRGFGGVGNYAEDRAGCGRRCSVDGRGLLEAQWCPGSGGVRGEAVEGGSDF